MLELTTYFDENLQVIISVPKGNVESENIRRTVMEATLLSNEKKCPLILFDIRACEVNRSYIDGFLDMSDVEGKIGI